MKNTLEGINSRLYDTEEYKKPIRQDSGNHLIRRAKSKKQI